MSGNVNTAADIKTMESSLVQVMSMLKHGMTDFEAQLWANLMEVTPKVKFDNFLQTYILSPQARYGAPKPNDAAAALGLSLDPDAAYAQLEIAVRNFGPYQTPAIVDPVLVQAIQNLGGWAKVNEIMPSSEQSFEVRAFRDRFNGALNMATNQVRIEMQKVEPLRAIGAALTPTLSLESSSQHKLVTNRDVG